MTTHQVVARNYAEASENRIHSDDIARRYGFGGALVPGVAVFGYLTRPLVERFGERWLSGAVASVRFLKPAYDGDRLTIEITDEGPGQRVVCRNAAGTLLATLDSALPARQPEPEDQRLLDAQARSAEREEISWDNVVPGRPFRPWHWQITEDGNQDYATQVGDDLPLYRFAAHPHWLLSVANTALTREYVMPAWIHTGSEIRFRELLKTGDTVEIRAVAVDKWERKGHQFVRVYLAYYRDSHLATEIFHTAIFRLAS